MYSSVAHITLAFRTLGLQNLRPLLVAETSLKPWGQELLSWFANFAPVFWDGTFCGATSETNRKYYWWCMLLRRDSRSSPPAPTAELHCRNGNRWLLWALKRYVRVGSGDECVLTEVPFCFVLKCKIIALCKVFKMFQKYCCYFDWLLVLAWSFVKQLGWWEHLMCGLG